MEQRPRADLSWRAERADAAAALSDDDIFVLGSLRLNVPSIDLELRVPQSFADILDMARVAASGVVQPGERFFGVDWERDDPDVVARNGFANALAKLSPSIDHWDIPLLAYQRGVFVGRQSLRAEQFSVAREVNSGSWVRPDRHGRGIGYAMRAAVLQLSFVGLDALSARSSSFFANVASARVSQKCGYVLDGTEVVAQGEHRLVGQRWLMTRERWREVAAAWPEVSIEGVTPALLDVLGATQAR